MRGKIFSMSILIAGNVFWIYILTYVCHTISADNLVDPSTGIPEHPILWTKETFKEAGIYGLIVGLVIFPFNKYLFAFRLNDKSNKKNYLFINSCSLSCSFIGVICRHRIFHTASLVVAKINQK